MNLVLNFNLTVAQVEDAIAVLELAIVELDSPIQHSRFEDVDPQLISRLFDMVVSVMTRFGEAHAKNSPVELSAAIKAAVQSTKSRQIPINIGLTPMERKLWNYLAVRPGYQSNADIGMFIWGEQGEHIDKRLKSYVNSINTKCKNAGLPKKITNLRNTGYELNL